VLPAILSKKIMIETADFIPKMINPPQDVFFNGLHEGRFVAIHISHNITSKLPK
jgi:hypothetical protein